MGYITPRITYSEFSKHKNNWIPIKIKWMMENPARNHIEGNEHGYFELR